MAPSASSTTGPRIQVCTGMVAHSELSRLAGAAVPRQLCIVVIWRGAAADGLPQGVVALWIAPAFTEHVSVTPGWIGTIGMSTRGM